jgi:uncharacterized protein HemX
VLEQARVADQVRLKAATAARSPASAGQAPALVRWAIAATLVIAVSGGTWYGLEMRRREGEEAKRQVLMSLNIAGSKLRTVQMKINHEQER